jgi:hypothetical protein
MFHSWIAHAGLPNRSDRFRLSVDVRFVLDPENLIVGAIDRVDDQLVSITGEDGRRHVLAIDEETMVRGPKGDQLTGKAMSAVVFVGANVIAISGPDGRARILRSVSRKYLDLPPAWFSELPPDWIS